MSTRKSPVWLCLLALAALTVLAGCGGGGPAGQAPVNDQLFTPNYVSSLDGLYHWNHLPMRVAFYLPANWQQLYPADSDLHIEAANQWNQPGKQALVMVVQPGQPADATVEFVRQETLGGNTQGLTTSTRTTTGEMRSAEIQVALDNSRYPVVSAAEARLTIAHEIGHALGIIGHSPDPSDLMYAIHNYGATLPPSTRDLNTVMTAYPIYFAAAGASSRAAASRSTGQETLITETIE